MSAHHTHAAATHEPEAPPARVHRQEQEPAATEVTEVAPGVLRAQLPISLPGLGHVNCYLLEDERGLAVIDPGLPGPDAWAALVDRLNSAGFEVQNVHTVVVTHSHPDHFGGAKRLRDEANASVVTHDAFQTLFDLRDLTDSEDSSDLDLNTPEGRLEAIERRLQVPTPWGGRRQGPPPEIMERIRREGLSADSPLLAVPEPTVRVIDGQTIRLARREWIAMHTPGHTFDHLCLYDPEHGVVFTGDHVLPSITPHIGGVGPLADPLAVFFESLERVAELSGVAIALPAHGHPFTDLKGRAEHIEQHHQDRLDIIRASHDDLPNGTVADYMHVLFQERSWGDLAESETYAHLEHLRELGEVERTFDGGLARYAPLGS